MRAHRPKKNFPFNEWWLMLIHGLLLLLLSYFLFDKPQELYADITIAGFIALVTGGLSIMGYYLADKNENSKVELTMGIFCGLSGLFFLCDTSLSQGLVTIFFISFIT